MGSIECALDSFLGRANPTKCSDALVCALDFELVLARKLCDVCVLALAPHDALHVVDLDHVDRVHLNMDQDDRHHITHVQHIPHPLDGAIQHLLLIFLSVCWSSHAATSRRGRPRNRVRAALPCRVREHRQLEQQQRLALQRHRHREQLYRMQYDEPAETAHLHKHHTQKEPYLWVSDYTQAQVLLDHVHRAVHCHLDLELLLGRVVAVGLHRRRICSPRSHPEPATERFIAQHAVLLFLLLLVAVHNVGDELPDDVVLGGDLRGVEGLRPCCSVQHDA